MHKHHNHEDTSLSTKDSVVCPVMNLPTSKSKAEANGLVRTHNGNSYYLCCTGCIADFEKNPEAFLKEEA